MLNFPLSWIPDESKDSPLFVVGRSLEAEFCLPDLLPLLSQCKGWGCSQTSLAAEGDVTLGPMLCTPMEPEHHGASGIRIPND